MVMFSCPMTSPLQHSQRLSKGSSQAYHAAIPGVGKLQQTNSTGGMHHAGASAMCHDPSGWAGT